MKRRGMTIANSENSCMDWSFCNIHPEVILCMTLFPYLLTSLTILERCERGVNVTRMVLKSAIHEYLPFSSSFVVACSPLDSFQKLQKTILINFLKFTVPYERYPTQIRILLYYYALKLLQTSCIVWQDVHERIVRLLQSIHPRVYHSQSFHANVTHFLHSRRKLLSSKTMTPVVIPFSSSIFTIFL